MERTIDIQKSLHSYGGSALQRVMGDWCWFQQFGNLEEPRKNNRLQLTILHHLKLIQGRSTFHRRFLLPATMASWPLPCSLSKESPSKPAWQDKLHHLGEDRCWDAEDLSECKDYNDDIRKEMTNYHIWLRVSQWPRPNWRRAHSVFQSPAVRHHQCFGSIPSHELREE